MSGSGEALVAILACATGVLLFAFTRWARSLGEPYVIATLVIVVTLGTEYCLRPLSILTSSSLGWDPDTIRPVTSYDEQALVYSAVVTFGCVAIFLVTVRIFSRGVVRNLCAHTDDLPRHPVSTEFVLLACATISLAVGLSYGSFGSALNGSFGRQNIGAGYIYALVNVGPIAVLVALLRTPIVQMRTPAFKLAMVLTGVVSAAVYILILGGRAELISMGIASLVILRWRFRRPTGRFLVAGVVLAVLASSMYRVVTREIFYSDNSGLETTQLVASSLRDPLTMITRGDVSSFDKLVVIRESEKTPLGGETYAAATVAAVPGGIIDSGLEGGSRSFTRTYLPERYARARTFEGVSLPGEALMNFGTAGPPLAFFAIGAFYGIAIRRTIKRGSVGILFPLAVGMLPTIIRADASNSITLAAAFALSTLIVLSIRFIFSIETTAQSKGAYERTARSTRHV